MQDNDDNHDFGFESLVNADNYQRSLINDFSPFLKGEVLEIGSGIGQMTKYIKKVPTISGLKCVEPEASYCKKFREIFPDQPLIQGTVNDIEYKGWDAIISINVLEHIEDDRGELAKYAKLLKQKNGVLTLFVPARPEIYAPLDKVFGHFRRYTKKDLEQKLNSAGFRIEKIYYYNIIGYFAWWFNFCLLKQRVFRPGAVRIFDQYIFPAVHYIENKLLHPPFGQSLVAIVRSV